jgi:hypothetical protein
MRVPRHYNPSDSAARVYEEFHGHPSTGEVDVEQRLHYHGYLAELGVLTGIKFRTLDGEHDITLEFETDDVEDDYEENPWFGGEHKKEKATTRKKYGLVGKRLVTHSSRLLRQAYDAGYKGVHGYRGTRQFKEWLEDVPEDLDKKFVRQLSSEYGRGIHDWKKDEEQKTQREIQSERAKGQRLLTEQLEGRRRSQEAERRRAAQEAREERRHQREEARESSRAAHEQRQHERDERREREREERERERREARETAEQERQDREREARERRQAAERERQAREREEQERAARTFMGHEIRPRSGGGFTVSGMGGAYASTEAAKKAIASRSNPYGYYNPRRKGPLQSAMDFSGQMVHGAAGGVDRMFTGNPYDHEFDFEDDEDSVNVLLCSNEASNQLYLVGGDQSVDLEENESFWRKYNVDPEHDSVVLGEVWAVSYSTRKKFDKDELIEYVHTFGPDELQQKMPQNADLWEDAKPPKEDAFACGLLPTLRYDVMNQTLHFDGGSYFITDKGIEE